MSTPMSRTNLGRVKCQSKKVCLHFTSTKTLTLAGSSGPELTEKL